MLVVFLSEDDDLGGTGKGKEVVSTGRRGVVLGTVPRTEQAELTLLCTFTNRETEHVFSTISDRAREEEVSKRRREGTLNN